VFPVRGRHVGPGLQNAGQQLEDFGAICFERLAVCIADEVCGNSHAKLRFDFGARPHGDLIESRGILFSAPFVAFGDVTRD